VHGQDRARRAVARLLKNRLNPGTHPLTAVLSELCPGALRALSGAASSYSPQAALGAACAEVERALSDRFTSRMSLEMNLDSTWADETLSELDIGAASEEAHRSRAAELLTERLLSEPPAGSLVPDRRDVHQLLDLASAALEASMEAQYAFAAIQPAQLEVSTFGDIDIVPASPAKANIRAWQQAKLEEQARAYSADETRPSGREEDRAMDSRDPGSREANHPEALRSVLRENVRSGTGFQALNARGLLAVDDELIEHCGFGLDNVLAVLGTVASWDVPAEPHPPIAHVSRAALVDVVTASSGLAREQLDAAARVCTLSAETIRQEGLRYWQLKERSARLALRPLIEPPGAAGRDDLWLLPRCAHRTQHLLMTYLNDQQLPWPDRDLPEAVRKAVKAWHKLAEDYLETELAVAAASAGLVFRSNLTPGKAAQQGLHLGGEIDLIAADPTRRRIWVIEAKHLRQVFSPLEIGSRIADFHGAGALAIGPNTNQYRQFQSRTFRPYVQKIHANTQAVRQNKQAALRLISARSPASRIAMCTGDDWEVIPLIVASHVEVSAFVLDPAVPFVLIDHLGELLTASVPPPPGWWSPQTN
jgi:hypothetical protein